MASNFLDYGNDATRKLRESAEDLKHLSYCFSVTGNERMAEELSLIAIDMGDARDLVDKAINDALSDLLEQSKQGVATMLAATFAGIEVAQHIDELQQTQEEGD